MNVRVEVNESRERVKTGPIENMGFIRISLLSLTRRTYRLNPVPLDDDIRRPPHGCSLSIDNANVSYNEAFILLAAPNSARLASIANTNRES
jgi:hypothetical protein